MKVEEEMWHANVPEQTDTRQVLRSNPATLWSSARDCALVGRGALRTDIVAPSMATEKLGTGNILPENRRPLSDNNAMFMYASERPSSFAVGMICRWLTCTEGKWMSKTVIEGFSGVSVSEKEETYP